MTTHYFPPRYPEHPSFLGQKLVKMGKKGHFHPKIASMILGKTPAKAIEWSWGSKIYLANFLYIEAIFDSEMVPKDVNVNVSAIFAIFSSKNGGQGAMGRSKFFQKYI